MLVGISVLGRDEECVDRPEHNSLVEGGQLSTMMEDGSIREAQPTGEFEDASTPKLQDRIEKATQDQDRQLDAIYSGVQRLHHAAKATNEEVISQNAMLDQVSVQISDTEVAVQQQTKAAKKVVRLHRKLCRYYVVIALLIIALIVIIFI